MPRTGIAYPVDDAWRDRVDERLKELGRTRAWLAKEAGCSRSLITELLERTPGKKQRNQTTYLPEIHKALEWPLPQPALAPGAVPEFAFIYEQLDAGGREKVLAAARRELQRLLDIAGTKKATARRH